MALRPPSTNLAEPGGEGSGDHHDQRQAAAGDGEVRRVLDAASGPHADGDGAKQIEHHAGDQDVIHVLLHGNFDSLKIGRLYRAERCQK